MKPFQTAYAIAAVAAAMFVYQVNHIGHLHEEAVVLEQQTVDYNSIDHLVGFGIRSLFDGFTFGAYAKDGIFTESNKAEQEARQINAHRASLISRYGSAIFYRNTGLIVAVIAVVVGFKLKKRSSNVA